MTSPNYHQHETQYRHLRENGFSGWGGERLDIRMAAWNASIESLISSPLFPRSGSEVLELGSGAGDSTIPLAERGYKVTGIEISPTAVTWAKEKISNRGLAATFVQGSVAERFPFADAAFAAVLDAACLHCIIGADRNTAFSEASRVLQQGGFFLVSHMVNVPRKLNSELTFNAETYVLESNGRPYRAIPPFKSLIVELEDAGFRVLSQEIRHNVWWDHAELWCVKD